MSLIPYGIFCSRLSSTEESVRLLHVNSAVLWCFELRPGLQAFQWGHVCVAVLGLGYCSKAVSYIMHMV